MSKIQIAAVVFIVVYLYLFLYWTEAGWDFRIKIGITKKETHNFSSKK